MRKNKQLASMMAAAVAAGTLFAASAFADSRHADETSWRTGGRRGRVEENRGRNDSRNDREWDRNGARRDTRNDSYQRGRSEPYYAQGRVSRVDRYRGGYRVWVGGSRYPFHVPDRYYQRDRFRVGVIIQLGGYYNPSGYYDYYDGRSGRGTRGDLRGVVESIDYRRDAFVIRNEATGSFVTVHTRDNVRRNNLRAGDYVELYGSWSRGGVFQAYDVDLIRY